MIYFYETPADTAKNLRVSAYVGESARIKYLYRVPAFSINDKINLEKKDLHIACQMRVRQWTAVRRKILLEILSLKMTGVRSGKATRSKKVRGVFLKAAIERASSNQIRSNQIY